MKKPRTLAEEFGLDPLGFAKFVKAKKVACRLATVCKLDKNGVTLSYEDIAALCDQLPEFREFLFRSTI